MVEHVVEFLFAYLRKSEKMKNAADADPLVVNPAGGFQDTVILG
jgi:hypothetical protein